MRALLLSGLLMSVALAGCFGFDPSGGYDHVPGEDWKPTGNEVRLKAKVVDWIFHEVYPGFHANLWAFCFAPQDAGDSYSANAIEGWNTLETDGVVDPAYALSEGESCGVPGPTLRVKQGDRVIVEFKHDHFHCHTIHWHGQHVPWQSDGAPGVNQESQCKETTEPFVYDFFASRAGSLWYHCHVDTHFHVMQGLYGVFIVEPQDDRWEPQDIDDEYILIYSSLNRELVQLTPQRIDDPHADHRHVPGECGASGVQGCQNPAADTVPDTWMLNGRSMPYTMQDDKSIVHMDQGDRIRLRLFNFGETMETIHTHGHDMYVTHRDGSPLPPQARFYVDTLTIGTAERYDVVIEANNPGLWMMHTHIDHHATNDHMAPGGGMGMLVYNSVMEEEGSMQPFMSGAELPGGKPYITPLAIPPDQFQDASFDVAPDFGGGTSQVRVSQPFEVDMPCAVRSVTVNAVYDPQFPGLGELALQVTDGDGRELIADGNGTLGSNNRIKAVLQPTNDVNKVTWFPGTFEAIVSGDNALGEITLEISVDYLESEQDFEFRTRALGGTNCDPALRVFDPLSYKDGKPEGSKPPA